MSPDGGRAGQRISARLGGGDGWGPQRDGRPWPPHQWLARDVWDLLREDADGRKPVDPFVDDLPAGTLLVLIAGFPCTDCTIAGNYEGWLGLQGDESVNFFFVGELKRYVMERRPDIYVHEILENVQSMRDPHKQVVLQAMGDIDERYVMLINSADWTACPRVRLWFASFPAPERDEDIAVFPRRASPWERGWSFRVNGCIPTFLRSRRRVPDAVRIPNYQAHPVFYLYENGHRDRWDLMTLTEVRNRIRSILNNSEYLARYPRARTGLRWIIAGTHRHIGHEEDCDQYVDWLHVEGGRHGIRPPTEVERARAAGLEQYCRALGLTGRRLYDVIGLSFDGYALMRRTAAFLRDWGNTGTPRHSARPTPTREHLYDLFRGLDPHVNRLVGARRASSLYPDDLHMRWLPNVPLRIRGVPPDPPARMAVDLDAEPEVSEHDRAVEPAPAAAATLGTHTPVAGAGWSPLP